MDELLNEIQDFLNEEREKSTEAQELEKLLDTFYNTPSYFERFKQEKQEGEQP